MNSKRIFRLSLLLTLVFLVPLLSLPLAHAGTNIIFRSFAHNATANGTPGTTLAATIVVAATGDALIVNIYGVGAFNSFTVTDTFGDTFTQKVASVSSVGTGASTYIWTVLTGATGGASQIVTVATGGASRLYGFTVMDYSNVIGFGITGTDQQDNAGAAATSTVSLTGTSGNGGAAIENFFSNAESAAGSTSITVTNNNAQVSRDSGNNPPCPNSSAPTSCESIDTPVPAVTFSLSVSATANGGTCPCPLSHSALELTGTATGTSSAVFQCFGNCGNPAITLVNTNSTHGFAFNQSITMLYEFQSSITGFLLNVTTNVAKTYTNGQAVFFGAYTVASCPLGQTPFSPQCPGVLQQGGGSSGFSAVKGRVSLANLRVPVFSGQWVGIAVSGQFTGLDLNDTNTGVNLFQTNEGRAPSAIIAAFPASPSSSKMSLWAWITGNAIIGTSPPTPGFGTSCFGLDCILTNAVNSLCQIVTTPCQTGSSLLLTLVLTIITLMVLLGGFSYLLPGIDVGRLGIGSLSVLIFLAWIVIFTSFSLMSLYVIAIIFSITAIIFGKQVNTYI
jgi:hypothetical protein